MFPELPSEKGESSKLSHIIEGLDTGSSEGIQLMLAGGTTPMNYHEKVRTIKKPPSYVLPITCVRFLHLVDDDSFCYFPRNDKERPHFLGEKKRKEVDGSKTMERLNYLTVIKNIFGERAERENHFINDFEVYLAMAYMDRRKSEKEMMKTIWNEIFSLGLGNWVKNIAGRIPEKDKKKESWKHSSINNALTPQQSQKQFLAAHALDTDI